MMQNDSTTEPVETMHRITLTALFENIDDAKCDAIMDALSDWMAERGVNFYCASNGPVDPQTGEAFTSAETTESINE